MWCLFRMDEGTRGDRARNEKDAFIVSLPRDSEVKAQKIGQKEGAKQDCWKKRPYYGTIRVNNHESKKKASAFGEYTKKRPPEKKWEKL